MGPGTAATAPGRLKGNLQLGPEGQQLLVLRSDYKRFGQSISISVAQDYTPVRESFRLMRQVGLVLGLAALLLILILQRVTVRRALRPLETAREQIAQLQQGQRSQLDTQVPVELEPLVAQINTCWPIPKTASNARATPWVTSAMP